MKTPKADRKAEGKRASPKTAPKLARDEIKAAAAAATQQSASEPVYDPEIARIILEKLADGETLSKICAEPGMPAPRTVRRWALDAAHPFAPQYTRAREIGYHQMADDLLDCADAERTSPGGVARDRLKFEARKWLLSKALPKLYGDKIALTDPDGGKLIIEFTC